MLTLLSFMKNTSLDICFNILIYYPLFYNKTSAGYHLQYLADVFNSTKTVDYIHVSLLSYASALFKMIQTSLEVSVFNPDRKTDIHKNISIIVTFKLLYMICVIRI